MRWWILKSKIHRIFEIMWYWITTHSSRSTSNELGSWEEKSHLIVHSTIDMVQPMMSYIDLPINFEVTSWKQLYITNKLNRIPTKSIQKTPYDIWTKSQNVSFMKIWECEAFNKCLVSDKFGYNLKNVILCSTQKNKEILFL